MSSYQKPKRYNKPDNYIFDFDTTLRDGEQTPGRGMSPKVKVNFAKFLDEEVRPDIIEAGFPASSETDVAIVRGTVAETRNAVIAALARTPNFKHEYPYRDIDMAGVALNEAIIDERGRIHFFISTSPIQRTEKLNMSKAEVLKSAKAGAIRCVEQFFKRDSRVIDIEFSCEDATRTEPDFLVEVYDLVAKTIYEAIEVNYKRYKINANEVKVQATFNIPDTVGYAVPEEYGDFFTMIRKQVPLVEQEGIFLSAHCHDDLGNATQNSLEAVRRGARQVETTVDGIGERAGNAAKEEVFQQMAVRRD